MIASDLVLHNNNQVVTTSRIVAKYFGKAHRHVVEQIKNLTAQNPAVKCCFRIGIYKNSRGRKYRMIYMNRDGFMMSVMSFTGKKANIWKWKFIQAFDWMENKLKHVLNINSPKSAWILQAYRQQKEIEQSAHKVRAYNKYLDNKGTAPISVIAKRFGLTANFVNKLLQKAHVLYRKGKNWYLTKQYSKYGLAKHSPYRVSTTITTHFLRWTNRGLMFIARFLEARGYAKVA